MHFFLDTSVLFKLFVHEESSEDYLSLLQEDPVVHVSHIAWVEFHSALRKRVSSRDISVQQRDAILQQFKKDWKTYVKVHVDETVLESAAQLVQSHSLKTLDSIQLACALEIDSHVEEPLLFLTADQSLQSAARREKLKIVE